MGSGTNHTCSCLGGVSSLAEEAHVPVCTDHRSRVQWDKMQGAGAATSEDFLGKVAFNRVQAKAFQVEKVKKTFPADEPKCRNRKAQDIGNCRKLLWSRDFVCSEAGAVRPAAQVRLGSG